MKTTKSKIRCGGMLTILVLALVVCVPLDAKVPLLELENEGACRYLYLPWNQLTTDKVKLNSVIAQLLPAEEGWATEVLQVSKTRLLDLDKDGHREFVISIDSSGSAGNIMFVMFIKQNEKVFFQRFKTHWGDVDRDIKDIDGDGSFEIITKNVLAESTGHATCVLWPTIYKWDGQGYSEGSKDFPEYYRKIVKNLDTNLEQLSKVDLEELAKSDKRSKEELAKWQQFRTADMQVAQFKAKQLLGEEKAGFDHAAQWSSSTYRELRRNAVTVLTGIMDSESRRYLQKLATDSDSTVALSAEAALKSGPTQVPFSGQLEKLSDSSLPKKDPYYPDDTMTKWGPDLSKEEQARIAKLSTTELVEMLKTGDTLHKYAALSHLTANGGWKKNFDLLLSIAAGRHGAGDMIVEGLVSGIDESASAEDKRLVDKFLDFLESELKKDESSVSHSQVVRCLGQVVLRRRRAPRPMSSKLESIKHIKPPYSYVRVITTLIFCLDNKDRNVRGDAIRWLGTVGAEDLTLANKVIATLEAQLAKEEIREKEAIKDNRRKVIEDALNNLRRKLLRGPESPEEIFKEMFES